MSNVADTTHSEEISTSAAIEASVTTGVSPVASVESSAVSPDPQPTEGHEEKVVTVTRTSTVTDNSTGDIVAQTSVSQEFDATEEDIEDDDFIADLISTGWTPRGRNNAPSVPGSKKGR